MISLLIRSTLCIGALVCGMVAFSSYLLAGAFERALISILAAVMVAGLFSPTNEENARLREYLVNDVDET